MGESSLIRRHNASVLSNLNHGDLVEFPRGIYSHWAVFIGNGEVVHLAGVGKSVSGASTSASSCSICGTLFNKAKVCKDNFWKVAADSKARINNSNDVKWRPRSAEEIVDIAFGKIGEVGYNALFSNCEHLAKFCRYGIAQSDQNSEPLIYCGDRYGKNWRHGIPAIVSTLASHKVISSLDQIF